MSVCDICNAPGLGSLVSAEDVRAAVFKRGFNPFALGLALDPWAGMLGPNATYSSWRGIVAQDSSDWNVCPACMAHLARFLDRAPQPTGVARAQVSLNPFVQAEAIELAETKYHSHRKWWQFWKS